MRADERRLEIVRKGFEETFGAGRELMYFSAPGRTEIGGNHTDHQQGRVLAAAVNLDMLAAVAFNDDGVIRMQSEGFRLCEVALKDLSVEERLYGTTLSLIRGMAAELQKRGAKLRGFDAYVISDVLRGSGLSSSAAYEVLVGTIINELMNEGKANAVEIAQIGQIAENVYFGKPCGLMDQMASSVGNLVTIDFADKANPVVEKIDFDFSTSGYTLCIIDSGADHADLTDEYAAVPGELKKVCAVFGKSVLREIPEEEFMKRIPEVRKAAGDRAVMRAFHVYADNQRVVKQCEALKNNDFDTFLTLVRQSGESSWMYLQNVIPAGYKEHQEMALALALCGKLLNGQGAYRVHGGGFAGTIQAFVPNRMVDEFVEGMEAVLGEGSCHCLSIRAEGGVRVK
ncbi:MAG: galactokinase [Lachnospiraceae bacterium]|nr:galactokinase [Lachnospiraceae bacterium]